MKKYRSFSSEFKKQLVDEIESGTTTLSQAARTHQISPSLIGRWKKQILEGTFRDKPTPRERELEKEVDYYKIKVAELTREKDLLKKINEYSQSLRRLNGSVVTGKNMGQSKRDAKG